MITIFLIQPKTGNIGNQLVASGLEQILRRAFGGKVNLVSLPADNCAKGGLSAKGIYEINRLADGLVIGPGNLFENGGLHCDIDALPSLSVPTMLFSVSMAEVYDRSGRFVDRTDSLPAGKIKAICRASDFVLVRDQATLSHLAKLNVPDVRVVGCPSIALDTELLRLPPPDPVATGAVLISVRHPKLMSVPYSLHAKLRRDLRRLIDLARHRGHQNVKLLCHDPADLSFAAEFSDIPMLYSENVNRFLGWLRDCQMNLTFRLHSFVPAISMGKPTLHFSYDQRALNLIQTLDLTPWDIDFVNTPDIIPRVQKSWDSWSNGFPVTPMPFAAIWAKLTNTMVEEMNVFAARVTKHSENCKF
jgi:hypothetical protein